MEAASGPVPGPGRSVRERNMGKVTEMKDPTSDANKHSESEGGETVRVELPREACDALSDMCAYLADTIAAGDCGCEACAERLAQAEAWEGVFRGMSETEPGMTHEVVFGQEGYVHCNRSVVE